MLPKNVCRESALTFNVSISRKKMFIGYILREHIGRYYTGPHIFLFREHISKHVRLKMCDQFWSGRERKKGGGGFRSLITPFSGRQIESILALGGPFHPHDGYIAGRCAK